MSQKLIKLCYEYNALMLFKPKHVFEQEFILKRLQELEKKLTKKGVHIYAYTTVFSQDYYLVCQTDQQLKDMPF